MHTYSIYEAWSCNSDICGLQKTNELIKKGMNWKTDSLGLSKKLDFGPYLYSYPHTIASNMAEIFMNSLFEKIETTLQCLIFYMNIVVAPIVFI